MADVNEERDIWVLTQKQFKAAHRIFGERIQNEQRMCRIYDVFAEPGSPNHNCLGCNFDEMTDQTLKFLDVCASDYVLFSPQQSFSIYALLLNSIWERMRDVFEIISLPESYLVRHFGAFIKARRWANFFKHPKGFAWMVHHPTYTFEGSNHSKAFLNDPDHLRIDDEFVKNHYASDRPKGLINKLTGKENRVVVILPNLEILTTDICACLEEFIEIITENKVYKEILDDKSTLINYFSENDV